MTSYSFRNGYKDTKKKIAKRILEIEWPIKSYYFFVILILYLFNLSTFPDILDERSLRQW